MYQAVAIYDLDGNFIGYTILKGGTEKLQTTNLWTEAQVSDLKVQLQRLNANVDIRSHWPQVQDPDVQALLNDPNWEPVPLDEVEVVDDDASTFVWDVPPSDEDPFGQMNEAASNIVYKTIMAPSSAGTVARIRKACEIVARARAGA